MIFLIPPARSVILNKCSLWVLVDGWQALWSAVAQKEVRQALDYKCEESLCVCVFSLLGLCYWGGNIAKSIWGFVSVLIWEIFAKGRQGGGWARAALVVNGPPRQRAALSRPAHSRAGPPASWNLVGERLIGWLTVPGKGSLPKEGPNKDIWSQGVHIWAPTPETFVI